LTEVVAPPPTVEEAISGEVVAADASSDPPGQEDTGAVAVKTMEETSARVEASDPPKPAALSVQTVMSTFGTRTGAAAGPFSSGLLPVLTKLLKDPSPLGRQGVGVKTERIISDRPTDRRLTEHKNGFGRIVGRYGQGYG
jgi:hypothetical protein